MSVDQAASSPPSVSETSLSFVAKAYFSPGELAEAWRLYKENGSYAETIAYLVGCGEDLRRTSSYLTIPGGKVHIPRPGRAEDSLAYLSIPLVELARRAFPDPLPQAEKEVGRTGAKGEQPGFWDASELTADGHEASAASAQQPRTTRPKAKKLMYVEQPIARRHRQPTQGWFVKDRGIGYTVEPMQSGRSYLVSLIHLKSGREMASVIAQSLDHERIREWMSACAILTDWTRGIQVILREKQGEQKQRAWSRQLEGIWREQKTTVKRQLAFF